MVLVAHCLSAVLLPLPSSGATRPRLLPCLAHIHWLTAPFVTPNAVAISFCFQPRYHTSQALKRRHSCPSLESSALLIASAHQVHPSLSRSGATDHPSFSLLIDEIQLLSLTSTPVTRVTIRLSSSQEAKSPSPLAPLSSFSGARHLCGAAHLSSGNNHTHSAADGP